MYPQNTRVAAYRQVLRFETFVCSLNSAGIACPCVLACILTCAVKDFCTSIQHRHSRSLKRTPLVRSVFALCVSCMPQQTSISLEHFSDKYIGCRSSFGLSRPLQP